MSAIDKLRDLGGAVAHVMRLDDWANLLTGLGVYGRDKIRSHAPQAITPIPEETLQAWYDGDGLAARIVDLPVDHAMRKGWRHVPPPEAEIADEKLTEIEARWTELDCWGYLGLGWKWGRLFGAGHILLGVDDGRELAEPLDEERVRSLDYLVDLDSRDVTPMRFYSDERSPLYGQPETYQLSTTLGNVALTEQVHATRFLSWGGAKTSRRTWRELGYHDYSVLQRPFDALQRLDSDWRSASVMMTDASVGVLKIRDFFNVIAGGSKDTFQTRMELINLGLMSSRIMPLDTEEDFQRIERTFTGVAQMLDKSTLFTAAHLGWPVTLLFGRSPDGMNATGESDENNWNAFVGAERQARLLPPAERLQAILLRSLGVDPAGWTLELPELSEESDKERAERRKLVADIDAVYLQAGVFTPEEIALARVRNGEWTDAPPDMGDEAREAREALLEQDFERAKEEPAEPEPAESLPPAEGGPMPPAMIAQQEAVKAAAGVPAEPADEDEEDEEE